jgi:hypothetical protein
MNKHLLELKNLKTERDKEKENNDLSQEGILGNYQDTEEPILDLNNFNDNSLTINISHLNNEESHMDLHEYKKEVDRNTEEKKAKLKEVFTFTKKIKENEIKEKFETRFQEILKEEQSRQDEIKKRKKEEIAELYKLKLEETKRKIKEDFLKNQALKQEESSRKCKNQETKLNDLENEISNLRLQLSNSISKDNYTEKYDSEVKKLEKNFDSKLRNYQSSLDSILNEKRVKIKNSYSNKKIDYQNSLKKSVYEAKDKNSHSPDNILKEKKNLILKTHQQKLQHYQQTILSHFENSSEKEKEDSIKSLNLVLNNLKENYDNLKEFYDEQKLLFKTEINIISTSNLINKLRNIFENKNSIFKNLLEQNYFTLKKKVRECENNKELMNFTNRDLIISKITELLTMIFYENIYEYLYNDVESDKEVIVSCLDDLICKCEQIISNLDFEKKVQLNMLICNPNFNF